MEPTTSASTPSPPAASARVDPSRVRIDRALLADMRRVPSSPALLGFLALEGIAAAVLVARRGEALLNTVALVWLGVACVGFLAWWAGRHPRAVQVADPVPAPALRAGAALVGSGGLLLAGLGAWPGVVLLGAALVGWLLAGSRRRGNALGIGWRQLLRDPRPFVPLLLLVGVTRFLFGAVTPVGLVAGLLSGVIQQVAYLVGLFAPLEALRGRADVAATAAALVFGAVHLPFNLEPNGGDWLAAAANAVIFQASVGMVAALAFVRHRAALPIGLVHGLAIA
jgi:hypothetical protein